MTICEDCSRDMGDEDVSSYTICVPCGIKRGIFCAICGNNVPCDGKGHEVILELRKKGFVVWPEIP